MPKKKKIIIHIPPEYILLIGKCKSYFGDPKNTKLFFDNFKKLNNKYHSLLLNSIEFNVKKMKEGKISIESIFTTLNLKKDKKLFIEAIMNDSYLEYLDRIDLDYLKEKLNGDYTNDLNLKSREFILDILKHKNCQEMKHVGNNFISKSYEIKVNNCDLDEYIYTVKDIINKDFFSFEDAESYFDNVFAKELGCNKKEDYKNITIQKVQSIEKIKNYKSHIELINDIRLLFDLLEKSNLIYEITKEYFIQNITDQIFYDALPCWLPSFKKKNISKLLFRGFTYKHGYSMSLISEVDYFFRLKNNIPIKSIYNFNNFLDDLEKRYSISKALLYNFDVRNKVCHGIFSDDNLMQDSFIIYIIALDVFIGLYE